MQRYLPMILLACVISSPFGGAIAQSKPTGVVRDVTRRNPLIDDVARNDPDGLRSLLQRLEILTIGQRDSGPARSGSTPTTQESAQIAANPLLSEAYAKDRAATLALLRATNEELDRARRREPMEQHRRVALVIGNSGDRAWAVLDTVGNDAALISNALLRQGFEVYAGHPWLDLDRRQLLATIRAFSQSITPGSVALIYYAGHGIETLQIDGRYVRTMKFERTSKILGGPAGNNTSAMQPAVSWLIWYDPVAGVFVKSEQQTPNATTAGLGAGMSGAFKVISVTHD